MSDRAAGSPSWKPAQSQAQPRPGQGQGRGWQIAVVAGLLLLLAGGLLAWLFYPDPFTPPRFLPLAVYEYPAGVPPVAFLHQDADALQTLGWSKSSGGHNSQQLRLLRADLKGLAGQAPELPLVVFLAGYLVEHEGKPYLFPAEARPDQPKGWLEMAEALRLIRECPSRRKLLLLDVMRPLVLPEQGLLRSDGLGRLWPVLEKAVEEDANLTILTACSPGQVSHASEELGQSAFGYFVARGLTGEADGWMPNTRKSGRVGVKALADYVRVCVDHWAVKNRGARQTPALLGKGDFALTLVEQKQWAASPLDRAYPAWLEKGWKKLYSWYEKGTTPKQQPAYHGLAQALLDAQAQWRAGFALSRVQSDLEVLSKKFTREHEKNAPPAPGGLTTLARLPPAPPDDVLALRELIAGRDSLPPKPPDDKLMPLKAKFAELGKAHKDKQAALAVLVVSATSAEPFGPESARLLKEVLDKAKGAKDHDEVRFLLRLCGRADRDKLWSKEVAKIAVDVAVREAKTRAFSAEALGWVKEERRAADALRSKVEGALFSGEAPWDTAKDDLLVLRGKYEAMQESLERVEEAIKLRDAASCVLPGLLMGRRTKATPQIRKAAEVTQVLKAELARGGAWERAKGPVGPLVDWFRQEQNSLQALMGPLSDREFPALIARMKKGSLDDIQQGQALLLTACLPPARRLALWAAYRDGLRACDNKSMEALEPGQSHPEQPTWDDRLVKKGAQELLLRDVNRAEAALLRLRLLTGEGLSDADAPLEKLKSGPSHDASWKQLAAVLKKAGALKMAGG